MAIIGHPIDIFLYDADGYPVALVGPAGNVSPVPATVLNSLGNVVGLRGPTSTMPFSQAESEELQNRTVGTGTTVSSGYTGGATPWVRLFGPNELRQAPWAGSAEFTTPTTAFKYVTAQSPANGPALFRREGAAILIDGSVVLGNSGAPTFGNLNTTTAGLSAGALLNTTLAILVYVHRLTTLTCRLRVGVDTGNYVFYKWDAAANMLVEGWNLLLAHTAEPIGVGNSPNGQYAFQSGSVNDGWYVGAGSFAFTQAVGYMAVEFTGIKLQNYFWVEGIYKGGFDKPQLTIGFDIQTSGLDLAKTTLDKYKLLGYAAVPTGNAVPANPQYLWSAADVTRMQSLFAAGWDMCQHGVSHTSLGTLTDENAILAEFESCRSQIRSIGCLTGSDLMATPNNSYSNRILAIGNKAGIRWMRHGINAPLLTSRGLIGLNNPLLQGAFSMANATDAVRTLQFIDLLIQYGVSGHIYTHAIQVGASDSINTNVTVFDAICAGIATRVAAGSVEVVVPSKFVRQSSTPSVAGPFESPNRLSLTIGASPFDLINTGYKSLRFVISGGTVTIISYSRDGTTFDVTGLIAGQFDVAPGDRLRITYSVIPTVIQYSV